MNIQVGSRLRVNLPFVDLDEAGAETPIDLGTITSETVKVWKPDGTELTAQTLTVDTPASGLAHWDAAAGVLDQAGLWKAQGFADGYKSAPVTWRVTKNPSS